MYNESPRERDKYLLQALVLPIFPKHGCFAPLCLFPQKMWPIILYHICHRSSDTQLTTCTGLSVKRPCPKMVLIFLKFYTIYNIKVNEIK